MKKALFLCFSLISLIAFSQIKTEVPIWVNSPSEEDKYFSCCFYYREKKSFDNKEINEKNFKSKLDELEKDLKTAISTETGQGPTSFSATMPELLVQAITDKMDAFLVKHQIHFKDIIVNGRKVKLSFRTADSSIKFDTLIEDEYGQTELGDLIIGYVGANSVKTGSGVANFSTERTQTQLTLGDVRIPLQIVTKSRYGESTISNDAEKFIKALQADFRKNLKIDGTVIAKGLGEAIFIINGK
jgi:hypothetical protein